MKTSGMVRALVALLLALSGAGRAKSAPPLERLEPYFAAPEIARPTLSPTGEFLGVIARKGDSYGVGIYDLKAGKQRFVGGSGKTNVLAFWWKSARQIIVCTGAADGSPLGYMMVDADGTNAKDLWQIDRIGGIVDPLPNSPDWVIAGSYTNLVRVNLKTQKQELIEESIGPVIEWYIDSAGELRAAWGAQSGGTIKVWWRAPGAKAWKTTQSSFTRLDFIPVGVDRDSRYLLVTDYTQGDIMAVSRFDTTTGTREVLVQRPDFSPVRITGLGTRVRGLAVRYDQLPQAPLVALSPEFAPGVALLQEKFPGFVLDTFDAMPDGKTWVVRAANSRQPGAFFLFDSTTGKSDMIGLQNSKLTENLLAPADFLSLPDRAGRTLTGYLWRPRGVARPPLVVLIPEALPRSPATNVFAADVQALVACGYAVLSVNGRGTVGFGLEKMKPAETDLGAIVREDCEDMIAALGQEGVIDASRVVALGNKLGGAFAIYLASTSKVFAGVVNIDGPAEITRAGLQALSLERDLARLNDRFGGWREANKFAQELSVLGSATRCTVPALHLYSNYRDKMSDQGVKVAKAVREAGVPAKVDLAYTWSEYLKPLSVQAREEAAVIQRVATFIDALPAKPAAAKAR